MPRSLGTKPVDISKHLPNGFHGAVIEHIAANYVERKVEFLLKLLVPEDQVGRTKSRYRCGRLEIQQLLYLALDLPNSRYDYAGQRGLEINGLLDTTPDICPDFENIRTEMGPEFFFHSFFVEEWNAFIHFSGANAKFQWMPE